MLAPNVHAAIAHLQGDLDAFEKVLVELIQGKKRMVPVRSEETEGTNRINVRLQQTPIAIVGMASVFPNAKNLQEYWENILHKVDCIADVPPSRWNVDDYYDPDPHKPDKTYCKRGGFIPDIDFNPMEFGLPPNLLETTDISQLLSLVVAKQALQDAGYDSPDFDREHTGVILGAVGRQLSTPLSARLQYPIWQKVLKSSGLKDEDVEKIIDKIKLAYVNWEESAFPGMLSNVIAGRIANRLDLGGINCTVDAACASSLAAFKMAISELVEYRCNMMLTGGVDPDNSAFTYMCFSKTPALSRRQESRPFDVHSDGMMLGEGIGLIVLKRLEDAERDRNKIYAVIRGIGTSSDGRYKSIYAPRPAGQVKALQRAYQDAGISPASVGLIEAHGTGTMAGDPAEFAGLNEVFSKASSQKQHIALGSVKSQIGHTKTAAGIASLIKTSLALHHKVLPPTINVNQPNPKLGIDSSPFYLNTETRPWLQSPRRAGVSSFGFGGTNFHVVLEEYQRDHDGGYRLHRSPQIVLLCAKTPEQLLARCQAVLHQLTSEDQDRQFAELTRDSQSLEIPDDVARIGFVAETLVEARSKLKISLDGLKAQPNSDWEHPQGICYRLSGMPLQGKMVALFPGQGSQYLEMGKELAINFPILRQAYCQMDTYLTRDGLQPISDIVFPAPVFEQSQRDAQIQQLQRTDYAQPAIAALSVGLYKILHKAGFKPDFVAGHSFGELTALWAAGVLSEEDYFSLVKIRGQVMAMPQKVDAGAMLAVTGDVSQIDAVVKDYPTVAIANVNSNRQIVLSGDRKALAELQPRLKERGYSVTTLPVAAAFHTPMVAHAQAAFAQAIESVPFKAAQIPVYSNVTGGRYSATPDAIRKRLKEQMVNSVRFKDEIETIYADGGRCFVEIGPRSILTNLVKDILGDRPHLCVALNASRQKDSDRQLREAVVKLRVAGVPLKDIDPYTLACPLPDPQNKKLNIRLNGASYVSEKTRQAFEEALRDQPIQITASFPQSQQSIQNGHDGVNGNHAMAIAAAAKGNSSNGSSSNGGSSNGNLSGRHSSNGNSPTHNSHRNEYQPSIPTGNSKSQTSHVKPLSKTLTQSMSTAQPASSRATAHRSSLTHSISSSLEQIPNQPMSAPSPNDQRVLDGFEFSLAQINRHQCDTLQVHQQYLDHQLEYAKIFFHLMQQQNDLLLGSESAQHPSDIKSAVIESLERNMMRFHDHQAETLRAHEQSLGHQSEYSKHLFQLIQRQYDRADGSSIELTETPSPSYLTESRVQRVEVPAAAQNSTSPPLVAPSNVMSSTNGASSLAPESVEGLVASSGIEQDVAIATSTLGEISIDSQDHAVPEAKTADHQEADHQEPVQESLLDSTSPPADASTSLAGIDVAALSQTLLDIVSEKTGYPSEMLEMDMDMEADLGIDSIKRVEILGAFMDMYPDLPQPNLEEMAEVEMRSLGQVADYMLTLIPGIEQSSSTPAGTEDSDAVCGYEVENSSMPATTASASGASGASGAPGSPTYSTSAFKNSSPVWKESPSEMESRAMMAIATAPLPVSTVESKPLRQTLLSIVSEKTGYPVESLSMDMDMESDLGVDPVKRVEIIGTLTERFPSLPALNSDVMTDADLQTLGQVTDYLQSLLFREKKTSSNPLVMNNHST
ncbi:MAG: beta-ketoacyl synthase N-terminal-like domain-containing protein [Elainellaceae cyanobacterium]